MSRRAVSSQSWKGSFSDVRCSFRQVGTIFPPTGGPLRSRGAPHSYRPPIASEDSPKKSLRLTHRIAIQCRISPFDTRCFNVVFRLRTVNRESKLLLSHLLMNTER